MPREAVMADERELLDWARSERARQQQEQATTQERAEAEQAREQAAWCRYHRRLEELGWEETSGTGEERAEHARWKASPDYEQYQEARRQFQAERTAGLQASAARIAADQEQARKLSEARNRRLGDRSPEKMEAERQRVCRRAVENADLWSAENAEVRAAVKAAEEQVRARYLKIKEERGRLHLKEDLE